MGNWRFFAGQELFKLSRSSMMPFSFLSTLRRRRKLDENYPKHIEGWANRLKSRVSSDDLTDLKEKYESVPLRRPRRKASTTKAKKRR
jgi:hypothetical protein